VWHNLGCGISGSPSRFLTQRRICVCFCVLARAFECSALENYFGKLFPQADGKMYFVCDIAGDHTKLFSDEALGTDVCGVNDCTKTKHDSRRFHVVNVFVRHTSILVHGECENRAQVCGFITFVSSMYFCRQGPGGILANLFANSEFAEASLFGIRQAMANKWAMPPTLTHFADGQRMLDFKHVFEVRKSTGAPMCSQKYHESACLRVWTFA
jgi:hypothetical protein